MASPANEAERNHRIEGAPTPLQKIPISKRAVDWFFGYDYFIAYRWVDGKRYASAVYDGLTAKGNELDCFLDEKHYGAGRGLPAMQTRALRKTTRLIVIVTPRAHDTDKTYIPDEVAEFRRIHPDGTIVPIGTEETWDETKYPESPLLPLLPRYSDKSLWIHESSEAFVGGKPSLETVAKLLNDFSEERGSARRLRWIRRVAVLLLALFVAAAGFAIYASLQRNEAQAQTKEAKRQRNEAQAQTKKANEQRSKAEKAQESAENALTRSFLRTIGAAEKFIPFADEREALWELSELEPDPDPDLCSLGETLAALAAQMDRDAATVVAMRGANAVAAALEKFSEGTDPNPYSLGETLAALAAQIPPARQMQLFGLSALFLEGVPQKGKVEDGQRKTVVNLCGLLNVQELSEVLKWPVCVGEAQKLVLTELEKQTGGKFDGDLWKFVEKAPSLGINNLDRPAKRPRVEDAIKELQELRAANAGKPGVRSPKGPN